MDDYCLCKDTYRFSRSELGLGDLCDDRHGNWPVVNLAWFLITWLSLHEPTNERYSVIHPCSSSSSDASGDSSSDFLTNLLLLRCGFDFETGFELVGLGEDDWWQLLSLSTRVYIGLLIVFMMIGIPLNVLILLVAIFKRHSSPSSSFLLINMTIMDLIMLLLSPIRIKSELNKNNWNWAKSFSFFGRLLCKMNHGLQATMLIGSLSIISIIAFDRFYMIKISSMSRNRGSKKYFIYSVIAWILGFVPGCISAPVIYKANLVNVGEDAVRCNVIWLDMSREECLTHVLKSNRVNDTCIEEEKGMTYSCVVRNIKEQTYWTVVVMVCIVSPITLTIVSYLGLIQQINAVRNTVRNIGNRSTGNDRQTDSVRNTVSMFCLAVIVCFGPLSAFHLLRAAKLINNGNVCEKIFETGSFLVHVFPVLNAILYSFIGPRFRRDLRNFLSRVRGPQESVTSMSMATERTQISRSERVPLSHLNTPSAIERSPHFGMSGTMRETESTDRLLA